MPALAKLGSAYGELRPSLASRWNLQSADAAISAHEQGDFSASAQLFDAMRRDDRIDGCLGTRVQGVLSLPFDLEASEDGDGRQNKAAAKAFRPAWERFATEEVLAEALDWRIAMGFAIGELIWRDDRGVLKDEPQRLKIWHPQFARWDFDTQRFVLNTTTGPVQVTHGDGKWVVFAGKGSRPWMRGAVRALWILWIARQYAWRDWNSRSEQSGQTILAAKVQAPLEPNERSQLVRELIRRWRGIVAEIPSSGLEGVETGLELLSTEDGVDVFDKLISKSDVAIAIRLLGQNLTTEVQGGSFAAATAHNQIRIDFIKADTNGLSSDTRGGIFEPWSERKYGSRDLAPWACWESDPPEDTKAEADAANAFLEAVLKAKQLGKRVKNLDELAEKYGLQLEDDPDAKLAPPAPKPGEQAPPPNQDQQKLSLLASGDQADGFLSGQGYADSLTERGTSAGGKAIAETLRVVLQAVDDAEDYEDLRRRLHDAYPKLNPEELSSLVEKAMVLAELGGHQAVQQDL